MLFRSDGKIVVVTGAAGGFGEGIARSFAALGGHVAVVDIKGEDAERVAGDIAAAGGTAKAFQADVSSGADMGRVAGEIEAALGKTDILINNAGITHKNSPMLDVDEATFDRVFAINVKSIYLGAVNFVPQMRAKGGGSIVNIASTAGIRPRPGLTWYNSSKGAVNLMSKSLAVELGPDRIRVNAICPVMGATGLLESFMGMPDTPENRAKFIGTIPMGRLSEPNDIAKAAVFLASDDAAFITGVEVPVDGGQIGRAHV